MYLICKTLLSSLSDHGGSFPELNLELKENGNIFFYQIIDKKL